MKRTIKYLCYAGLNMSIIFFAPILSAEIDSNTGRFIVRSGQTDKLVGRAPTVTGGMFLQLPFVSKPWQLQNVTLVSEIGNQDLTLQDILIAPQISQFTFNDADGDLPSDVDPITLLNGGKIVWTVNGQTAELDPTTPLWQHDDVRVGNTADKDKNAWGSNSWANVTFAPYAGNSTILRGTMQQPVELKTQTGFPDSGVQTISNFFYFRPVRPGLDINGIRVRFSELAGKNFPTNGFPGAYFHIVTPLPASYYNWSISPKDAHVILQADYPINSTSEYMAGKVTLNSRPPANTTYTITAIPKVATDTITPITHSFKIENWFVDASKALNLPAAVTFDEAKAVCEDPQKVGANFRLPEISEITLPTALPNTYTNNTLPTGFSADGSDRADGNNFKGRALNGKLWSEWGQLTRFPTFSANAYFWTETSSTAQPWAFAISNARIRNDQTTGKVLCMTKLSDQAAPEKDNLSVAIYVKPTSGALDLSKPISGNITIQPVESKVKTTYTARVINTLPNGSLVDVTSVYADNIVWELFDDAISEDTPIAEFNKQNAPAGRFNYTGTSAEFTTQTTNDDALKRSQAHQSEQGLGLRVKLDIPN